MSIRLQYFLAIISLLFLTIIPARAGGTLSLEDAVTSLAGQSPKLMKEISLALKADKKNISDIVCDGLRLGRHWDHLGGARIPTFNCPIGGKTLIIDGTVYFYDATGHETGGDPKTSRYISMSNVKWKWQ